jgi:DDE superfamily endonuclease
MPYRGTRYHLKEWGQVLVNATPANYKELFNLRHSSLRNVIERKFGTWKRQFKILRETSEYPIDIQIKIITALGVVSNYIFDDGDIRYGDHDIVTARLEQDEVPGDQIIGQTSGNANAFRDELAQRMW